MKNRKRVKRLDPNTVVLIKQIGLGFLVICLFVGMASAIWFGTRIDRLTLTLVEVSGGETISHEDVRARAMVELEGEYFGFIPRRFAWFYPKQDIIEAVDEIERAHDVHVHRRSGRVLYVSFEEHLPRALWCSSVSSTDCMFVDDEAYAYTMAPQLSGGSFVRYFHTSEVPTIGKTLTSKTDFDLLQDLARRIEDEGWFISHFEIDAARDAFAHIVGGGELKMTLTQSPEETVDNLRTILLSEDFQHLEPGNFAYIDLRFGNKVFVNEELAAPGGEAASSTESTLDLSEEITEVETSNETAEADDASE